MKLYLNNSLRLVAVVSAILGISSTSTYSTGIMKVNSSGHTFKFLNRNVNSDNAHKPFRKVVLKISNSIIPSGAKIETGVGVYEFYEPVWEQLLTSNQSNMAQIRNGALVIKSSLWTFFAYHVFGDFNGLCLRKKLCHLFKKEA